MNLNWNKYGIDISKQRGGKMLCPQCSHTRKNKSDLCLSVDLASGLFNCHNNCGFHGSAAEFRPAKEYTKPVKRLEKVSSKIISWFENTRKISNNTLLRFGITESMEFMPQAGKEMACICFNYLRNNELINIKFRDGRKGFKLSKDAELIFYNIDSIKEKDECIIVEGEIDCLTFYECGIYNVVSVPNGASKGNQKLEYLDNCWNYFKAMNRVVLAVDSDEAGISLKDELARRIGKERCFTVEYSDGCKDINEVLVKNGKDAVIEVLANAKEIPLEGIMYTDEIYPIISEWYQHGYPKGAKAGIDGFDKLLSFLPGQLTIITGIPGHGKDEFTNEIMTGLSKNENWTWGVCGFEETAPQTFTKIAEKFGRKAFDFRKDPMQRLSVEEFEYSVGMVDKYFYLVNTDQIETDLDGILSKIEEMVGRHGINGFCLNPWNWVESNRPSGTSETDYIGQCLTKIAMIAKRLQIHFILIAHPYKMKKGMDGKYEVPNLYSINGSANFYNKAHNGITVYRNMDTNVADVYTTKIKQSWLGEIGSCSFTYNTYTRQYIPV